VAQLTKFPNPSEMHLFAFLKNSCATGAVFFFLSENPFLCRYKPFFNSKQKFAIVPYWNSKLKKLMR
jgi:hypothetical protein